MWTSPKPPFFKAFGLRALQRASMKLQLRSVGLAVLETQREAVKDGHLCPCVGAGAGAGGALSD